MLKKDIKKKISRYLAGECNDAEKNEMDSWIDLNEENEKEFNTQKEIWEKIITGQEDWEVDSSWNSFAAEHEVYKPRRKYDRDSFVKNYEHISFNLRFRKYKYLIRVASILLIMAACAFALLQFELSQNADKEIVWKEKITKMGEKTYITLKDGTSIVLNGGSKLKYPSGFNGNRRDVYLEGEAYFKVTHNRQKSFVVHSGRFTTVDLGTEFNIKAFPNDNKFSVALVSGKIKIEEEKNNLPVKEIVLKPSQQFTFNKITGAKEVNQFDYFQVTGWRDNILIFKKKPMKDVITVLYRAYGVQFELADTSIYNVKVNANFKNESLWTVINAIKAFTGLDYKSVNDSNGKHVKIIFYKNKRVN